MMEREFSELVDKGLDKMWRQLQNNELKPYTLEFGMLYPGDLRDRLSRVKKALLNNPSIEALDFCAFGTDHAVIGGWNDFNLTLFEALSVNKTLHSLNLANCCVEDTVMENLCSGLKSNNSLRYLNLSRNYFQALGHLADALALNIPLQMLDVSQSEPIPLEEWETLAQALAINTNLLTLDLQNCKIDAFIAEAIAEVLKKNQTLTCLQMSFNDINNPGFEALMNALSKNSGLLTLDITECGITSVEGLPHTRNRTLTSLILDGNHIGKDSASVAEGLKRSFALCTLSVSECELQDAGLIEVISALRSNSSVEILIMESNVFGDSATKSMSEYLASDNCSLKHLNAKGNVLDLSILINGILPNKSLQELKLSGINLSSLQKVDGLASAIQGSSIKSLEIDQCSIGDEEFQLLASLFGKTSKLRCISMMSNEFSHFGLASIAEELAQNTSIEMLVISHNHIGNEGMRLIGEILKSNCTLAYLYIADCHVSQLTGLVEGLKMNSSLHLLDLNANDLAGSCIADICQIIRENKSLTFFHLAGMKEISSFAREIERTVENENMNLLSNVISNHDTSSTVCLPSITRNQEIMISRVKIILGLYLLRQSQHPLMDMKNCFGNILHFFTFPIPHDPIAHYWLSS
jgi:Ran GTPase-activating protein (RanGAP) involved in mRNA processing and transport